MAKRKKNFSKKDVKYYAIALAIVLIGSLITGLQENGNSSGNGSNTASGEENLEVHFLDVGQGLCILAQMGDEVLIYDGGDRETSSFVVSYLQDEGITEIDYMISSHYDSDHLSGLIGCLNSFDVKNVIGSNYKHDSKLYGSFMDAVEEEGLTMQYPKVGQRFHFGDAEFMILAPKEIGSDRLLTAPVSGSSSLALEVAITWPEVPIATPRAMGSVMRSSRNRGSDSTLATIPVRMIAGVVMAPMPPESWLRGTPMAEVTLLGSRETVSSRSKPTARQNSSTIRRLAAAPAVMPARMASQFFFRMASCSYMGMARHTVAGVISQESSFIPS